MPKSIADLFGLNRSVAVITGGAGLLGVKHAEAIALAGGIPVLWDIAAEAAARQAAHIASQFATPAFAYQVDITRPDDVRAATAQVQTDVGPIDILINNAANNPKAEAVGEVPWSRFEQFSFEQWQGDLGVGLTGAFLCSQAIGTEMARRGHGVILNIASDLAVIAPDQRLYGKEGLANDQQPVKPVTYSIVKTGLLGLTRYLATYWATQGVRVNAISPGGVYNHQPDDFVQRLTNLIPMGRMADADEYQAAIIFLCGPASAYMTGANLIIDGGRTAW